MGIKVDDGWQKDINEENLGIFQFVDIIFIDFNDCNP